MQHEFGKCEICDTPLQERNIYQDFWINNRLIIIGNVPAGVCPQCSEKVVRAEVGEHIAELLKDSRQIEKAPTLSVPLVDYRVESMAA